MSFCECCWFNQRSNFIWKSEIDRRHRMPDLTTKLAKNWTYLKITNIGNLHWWTPLQQQYYLPATIRTSNIIRYFLDFMFSIQLYKDLREKLRYYFSEVILRRIRRYLLGVSNDNTLIPFHFRTFNDLIILIKLSLGIN